MIALIDSDSMTYKFCFACAGEPLEYVLGEVDQYIHDIVSNLGTDDFQLYLTGPACWRRDKYSDYKANRKTEKPPFWQEVRDHLVQEWNAVVSDDGREADDHVAAAQTEQTCIVSIDKDLNTIQGWHYHPDKKLKYFVSQEDADLFFWCQMIMGDTTDNIKGIPRKGKMAAYKILSEAVDPKLAVIAQYKIAFEDDWEQMYNKNYELLKIG